MHLVRAALRYVNDEDSRDVVTDLKKIYQAASALEAEQELKNFANRWDTKYPTISKQWRKSKLLTGQLGLKFIFRRDCLVVWTPLAFWQRIADLECSSETTIPILLGHRSSLRQPYRR